LKELTFYNENYENRFINIRISITYSLERFGSQLEKDIKIYFIKNKDALKDLFKEFNEIVTP